MDPFIGIQYQPRGIVRKINKNMLPKILMDEMQEAFRKSQEFLDYQTNTEHDKKSYNNELSQKTS